MVKHFITSYLNMDLHQQITGIQRISTKLNNFTAWNLFDTPKAHYSDSLWNLSSSFSNAADSEIKEQFLEKTGLFVCCLLCLTLFQLCFTLHMPLNWEYFSNMFSFNSLRVWFRNKDTAKLQTHQVIKFQSTSCLYPPAFSSVNYKASIQINLCPFFHSRSVDFHRKMTSLEN